MVQLAGKRMYAVGALILYGRTGVCCVEDIAERKLPGKPEPILYYVLRPLYQKGTIAAPVEKIEDGTIFSRTLMSKKQAQAFIEALPSLSAKPYHNSNLNELREHYRRQIQSLTSQDMARLIRSIYKKCQDIENKKRKLSMVDQRFMDEAEALLYGELAAALDIDRDEVKTYISRALQGK